MAMRLDHGTDGLEEVHGINVTPFIDVMLVLLFHFKRLSEVPQRHGCWITLPSSKPDIGAIDAHSF